MFGATCQDLAWFPTISRRRGLKKLLAKPLYNP